MKFPEQGIVKSMAKNFFNCNKPLIEKVLLSNTSLNHLHYSIVLKDDNIDNRNTIFDFLNRYDLLDMGNKYPVYFQFIPTELAHKINSIEEITFAEEQKGDIWEDSAFIAELDCGAAEYKGGRAKVLTLDELEIRVRKAQLR
jgi:hypothetical protein